MSDLVLNAGLLSWIGDWFYGIWISLWLLIDNVIYIFINWIYRIFILIAQVDIFGGGEQIEAITRRIYIIVGIAMLFIFAYNLVLLIINPEGKQIGNMAKVVQNAIISIILVTLLPLIFSYLTTIQNHVLESNVIGQVILGASGEDMNNTNKKAGVRVAIDIFSAFYHPDGQTYISCKNNPSAHDLCPHYVQVIDDAKANDSITSFIWDGTLKDGAKDGEVEYNWIISTIAGGFALWMFVSFALDIGVRVAKLAFYEIISPIPVMMRILPGDKMFDKWFKGLTSTYLSLFIRLGIIYFAMYAITLVPNILTNMWAKNGDSFVLLALANVVVILGILQFAKEAPKLLSDLFGGSGDGIKFGITKKLQENPISVPFGMVRSGVYAQAYRQQNKIPKLDEEGKPVLDKDGNPEYITTGDSGGFFKGAWRGRHGYKEGRKFTDEMITRVNTGATTGDVVGDKFRVVAGLKTSYEEQEFKEKQRLIAAGTEELKESNKELKESISSLEDSIKDSIEKITSKITGDLGDVGGYYLKGNYSRMNEILEQAIRDKAKSKDIDAIREAIKNWKKTTSQDMRDKAMSGKAFEFSELIDKDVIHTLEIAAENIKEHIAKKGISTYKDGKWTVNHDITVKDGHWQIGDLKTELKISDIDIAEIEKTIKDEVRNRYRAKKGSSDWVRRDSGSSKGS